MSNGDEWYEEIKGQRMLKAPARSALTGPTRVTRGVELDNLIPSWPLPLPYRTPASFERHLLKWRRGCHHKLLCPTTTG
jgi:hypothetical protein